LSSFAGNANLKRFCQLASQERQENRSERCYVRAFPALKSGTNVIDILRNNSKILHQPVSNQENGSFDALGRARQETPWTQHTWTNEPVPKRRTLCPRSTLRPHCPSTIAFCPVPSAYNQRQRLAAPLLPAVAVKKGLALVASEEIANQ
jgi:hypothetical protein